MQQHRRRLAFLIGSSLLTAVSVLVACSDNSAVPLPGGSTSGGEPDSGHSTTNTSGGPNNTGDDDDGSTTNPDGGAGGDCGAAPTLHSTALGFYCAFFKDAGPDSGGASNCRTGETCCNPGKQGSSFPLSYCAPSTADDNGITDCQAAAGDNGSTWVTTGGTTWECGSPTNCGTGKKCCAFSQDGTDGGIYIAKDTSLPAACGAHYVSKIGGTKCADDCAVGAGELELCSSTDPCSDTSQTCVPASVSPGNRAIGVCQK